MKIMYYLKSYFLNPREIILEASYLNFLYLNHFSIVLLLWIHSMINIYLDDKYYHKMVFQVVIMSYWLKNTVCYFYYFTTHLVRCIISYILLLIFSKFFQDKKNFTSLWYHNFWDQFPEVVQYYLQLFLFFLFGHLIIINS